MINVTKVDAPWQATPESDPMYTIYIEGQGEPQKTFSKELAVVGTHEAESYQSKAGKTYWRTPEAQKSYGGYKGGAKEFKADPIKQESIEWQNALTNAREAVFNYHTLYSKEAVSLEDYKKDIVEAVVTFTQTIKHKPETIEHKDEHQPVKDEGDYVQINPTDFEDLPPIEAYDEMDATSTDERGY